MRKKQTTRRRRAGESDRGNRVAGSGATALRFCRISIRSSQVYERPPANDDGVETRVVRGRARGGAARLLLDARAPSPHARDLPIPN
jgi:hypothetical protein